jgi:hypothetical protein
MTLRSVLAGVLLYAGIVACNGTPRESSAAEPDWQPGPSVDSLRRIPGYVVDSAIAMPEALRRFQAATPGSQPKKLEGGARTLDALLRTLAEKYASDDTDALRHLALTRGEFAYLYYPESPYPEPPYQLAPELLWYLVEQNSARGLERGLQRVGTGTHYISHSCANAPKQEGNNRVHGPCTVEVRRMDGSMANFRLANAVVERDGVFKLVSFDNDF